MADIYEKFVAAYLRLNGYFTVPNFILHAADDPTRISGKTVGNITESDILALRMPYSREVTGALEIQNHTVLVDGDTTKINVIIAEVKSGKENRPNRAWRNEKSLTTAKYILRFVGTHNEHDLVRIASGLSQQYHYQDAQYHFRYIIFAHDANKHYAEKGVQYITFIEAIQFIVAVRGQCWIKSGIGVASAHNQWDEFLVKVFDIANQSNKEVPTVVEEIAGFLRQSN